MSQVKDHTFNTCLLKQSEIKKIFTSCPSKESKYQKIIEIGKTLTGIPEEHKIDANIVIGCQSTVYLYSYLSDGKVHFSAESQALISSGLAALLIKVYDKESPETILQCPPLFIEEIGLIASLSPSRSNGFASIYFRMKQDAVKFLLSSIPK